MSKIKLNQREDNKDGYNKKMTSIKEASYVLERLRDFRERAKLVKIESPEWCKFYWAEHGESISFCEYARRVSGDTLIESVEYTFRYSEGNVVCLKEGNLIDGFCSVESLVRVRDGKIIFRCVNGETLEILL